MLENLYLDNNRELQHDFGPKVHEGPVRRRNAVRQSFTTRDGNNRRSETSLIAHLGSHSDSITGLAVSPDHMFFVSASDDKTVKVWDTARLERNVTSKPRHTYGQHHARVKAICILEAVHCFASAADDGSLHVVRVHMSQSGALPKYNKLQVIREHRVDHPGEYITCMTHYNTGARSTIKLTTVAFYLIKGCSDTSSNLVYATTHSVITILDLQTMRVLQTMQNPRHFGPITCICLDRKRSWIVVGTSMGNLTLWDRRFGLLLKSWQVAEVAPGKSTRIHQCVVHPTLGRGRWIMVALETSHTEHVPVTLIEVWDIEKCMLVETFLMNTTSSSPEEPQQVTGVDTEPSPAAAIAALVRSRQTGLSSATRIKRTHPPSSIVAQDDVLPTPSPTIRAIVVGLEFGGHQSGNHSKTNDFGGELDAHAHSVGRGFMITGSEDRRIRLWDLGKLERTVVFSGLESDHDKPSYRLVF